MWNLMSSWKLHLGVREFEREISSMSNGLKGIESSVTPKIKTFQIQENGLNAF